MLLGNLFVFMFGAIFAASNSQNDGGTIHFNTYELDFGTVKRDSDPYRRFVVTNIGKSQLIISSCNATCGCTVPNCPQDPIQPGKSTLINVRYNTNRVGQFSKQITVYSSDQKNPVTILKIHGEVLDEAAKQ
jgi:hypothetical protein